MSTSAYKVLEERGFIQQVTDADAVAQQLAEGPVTFYVGYDPTAPSLHIGHLFTVMPLVHLARLGHRPIALVGGGTAMVGDPSGRTEMRQMLTRENIETNVAALRGQLESLLGLVGQDHLIVDNSDWILDLNYIDFLRDIGVHFSVNRMLSAEAYRQRLEKGLSFIEFNYQLLQAYDFLELHRRYGCSLQMGGDDQWGNILAGVDLVRRLERTPVQGLTFPLLTTASGQKMGKTAQGAVWLDPQRTPPYAYYQYWVNCADGDVTRWLKAFTLLPVPEIEAVTCLDGARLNAAKSVLAFEATRLVHGLEEAAKAHAAALGAFGGRALPADILPSSQVPRQVDGDAAQLPTTALDPAVLQAGLPLLDLLTEVGLTASKSAARRLIDQGGVRINDTRVTEQLYQVTSSDLREGSLLLRAGKKKVHRIVTQARR